MKTWREKKHRKPEILEFGIRIYKKDIRKGGKKRKQDINPKASEARISLLAGIYKWTLGPSLCGGPEIKIKSYKT